MVCRLVSKSLALRFEFPDLPDERRSREGEASAAEEDALAWFEISVVDVTDTIREERADLSYVLSGSTIGEESAV